MHMKIEKCRNFPLSLRDALNKKGNFYIFISISIFILTAETYIIFFNFLVAKIENRFVHGVWGSDFKHLFPFHPPWKSRTNTYNFTEKLFVYS